MSVGTRSLRSGRDDTVAAAHASYANRDMRILRSKERANDERRVTRTLEMGRILLTMVLHHGGSPEQPFARISRSRAAANSRFPLELHGDAAPRDILEQEWWLAALQEPSADFGPLPDDWPTTTLPAFDAVWCASQKGEAVGRDYDLRVRRAFFAEGRNIGNQTVLLEIAEEAGLDLPEFKQLRDSGRAREAILAEAHEGRERYRVRGTPTVMLPNGDRQRVSLAFPTLRERKVVSIRPLPCYGEDCRETTRSLFEAALQHGPPTETSPIAP